MEWIKKNWYLIPVLLIVGYFVVRYLMAEAKLKKQMQNVRDGKTAKKAMSENGQAIEEVTTIPDV